MATPGAGATGVPGRFPVPRGAWLLWVGVGSLLGASWAPADEQKLDPATLRAVKGSTVYLRVALNDRLTAEGSGFFAGEAGMVVTNAHVVGMLRDDRHFPQRIDVVVHSGQEDERSYLGQLVGVDPEADLAVLRVIGNDLPPPLKVATGRDLEETQPVFIFGFPLGRQLGKQITVSTSSISSLRRNDAGVLERIQVNGGMHPGNSGGPVVDARGRVVGVAVSRVRDTELQFAVPGDRVQAFLGGRVASVSVGRPRPRGGKLVAVVRAQLIDPLGRIRSVCLDYWLGARGLPRPPSSTPPAPVKGDTPHQSLPLRLEEGTAEGQWTIPLPAERQVIWVQPCWVLKSGEKRWGPATVVRPSPPEEDEAAAGAGPTEVDEEKREAAAQKDLKALEGTWKLVRREVSGSLENVDDLKPVLLIEDGKMTWTHNERETGLQASVELNPTATPPAIDLEFTGPKRFGEQLRGIYELKGDKLTLCWNKAEDRRPRKFTTRLSLGCGTVQETYRRIPD